jgi:TolB-like protein/DNA-binding winged helix-turn-helix (wHTH) protein
MQGAPADANPIRFGIFEVDPQAGQLRRRGLQVRLQDQPFQVLLILLERPGKLVTREEMQRRLWAGDTFVDFDTGLNRAISKIREALGDSAENPRFIETLPRKGYRFIGSVEGVDKGVVTDVAGPNLRARSDEDIAAATSGPRRVPLKLLAGGTVLVFVAVVLVLNLGGFRDRLVGHPNVSHIQSLAVLPLENLSHNPDQEYFSDGMTDELTGTLAKIGVFRVTSRTSAMQFKGAHKPLRDIARTLNVEGIVEGSVLRSGDHVRVNVELIEAATDKHLWAESYERKLGDVLTLQSDVAHSIANAVQARLSPRERDSLARARPIDPEAYEHYLRGRFFWNKMTADGLNRAIADLEQAIAKDPGYALAYAGLADCYAVLPYTTGAPSQEAYRKARTAAAKALDLDPNLVEAVNTLATVAAYGFDWSEAEKQFKRALKLNPGYAQAHHDYGFYLLAMGRLDEAAVVSQRARELDPLSLYFSVDFAALPYFSRRYDDAIRQITKVLEMDKHLCPGSPLSGSGLPSQGNA